MTKAPSAGLTGRKVFLIFALFFGTIASADTFLIVSALRTFSGAETSSAYRAGQLYNREIAGARAQAARGWRLETSVSREEDGFARIAVAAKDEAGAALSGRAVTAALQRPTSKREDRAVVLAETAPGAYGGTLEEVAPGQWDLVVDVMDGAERLHRVKTRVLLR
jgi:nitrogen fixation protein FixH